MNTSRDAAAARQWLPLGWKLMVAWGVLNIVFAIVVSTTSLLIDPTLFTFGVEDQRFVGMSWAEISGTSPAMGLWMVLMMATMCAMMMGYGILTASVAWSAYRRGERWAWRTLLASNVFVLFPYFAPIAWLYASRGLYGMFTSSGPFPSGVNIGIPFAVLWTLWIYFGLWLPREELT